MAVFVIIKYGIDHRIRLYQDGFLWKGYVTLKIKACFDWTPGIGIPFV